MAKFGAVLPLRYRRTLLRDFEDRWCRVHVAIRWAALQTFLVSEFGLRRVSCRCLDWKVFGRRPRATPPLAWPASENLHHVGHESAVFDFSKADTAPQIDERGLPRGKARAYRPERSVLDNPSTEYGLCSRWKPLVPPVASTWL